MGPSDDMSVLTTRAFLSACVSCLFFLPPLSLSVSGEDSEKSAGSLRARKRALANQLAS